ncbi:MAG: hypothetical protein SOH80_09515 [Eubacteriales bacterium]|jgi:hypothetical protein
MAARRQISAGHRRVNSQRTVYRASAASGSGMRRTYAGAGNSNRGRAIRLDTYEDGNAVRRLDEETEEVERPRKKRQVSRRTRENRERAMNVGIGYILFLTAVCIASVYFCIHYLQLRSELINQNETIAAMQNDLSKLTTDNDALYKSALASVSMDDVRQTALTTLNLHYATESQIRYYDANDESYVRQFTDIDGNN